MRKFLLLTILALFLCATGVYAAQNLKIIEDSLNMTGKTTQSPFSKTFIINNTGTENLNVTFTGFNLTNGTNYLAIIFSKIPSDQPATFLTNSELLLTFTFNTP